MRILLVEDNASTAKSIELTLKQARHDVYVTEFGEDAIELVKLFNYDAVVLDLGLPDLNGLEVIQKIRLEKRDTPILVLTGDANTETKVKSFGLGGDDYLTKPVNGAELVARIQAIVRRFRGHSQPLISIGSITINLAAKSVIVDGKPVSLTGMEYRLLEFLCLRKGITLSKNTFLDHIYGGIDEPNPRTIDAFISKLRKKLSSATGGKNYIETIRGMGYVLRDPGDLETSAESTEAERQARRRR